jgi:hypothetical protein
VFARNMADGATSVGRSWGMFLRCATDTVVAPGFVDAAGQDCRLTSASPAIDVGIRVPGVTDTWAGDGPDLGRYERLP